MDRQTLVVGLAEVRAGVEVLVVGRVVGPVAERALRRAGAEDVREVGGVVLELHVGDADAGEVAARAVNATHGAGVLTPSGFDVPAAPWISV